MQGIVLLAFVSLQLRDWKWESKS